MTAAEQMARQFHEAYERLAPGFGYVTRPETREFDPESTNGQLMIAVCEEFVENAERAIARLGNTLLGLSRWDRERLGVPPIATHNQAGQLLPREQRWDPLTGRYYGDESVDG